MKFSISDLFSKCETADLVAFTEEIRNEKLHFLCSGRIHRVLVPPILENEWNYFSLFQPRVAYHTETSHLIYRAKQITSFYMKRNNGLKWVYNFSTN